MIENSICFAASGISIFFLRLSGQLPEDLMDRWIVVESLGLGVLTLHIPERCMVELQLYMGVPW